MTSVPNARSPLGLGSGIEALRAKRGWIITLGIIYVVAGLIALGSVVMATVVSVFVVGIMMLIAGVAEVINAFQVKSWGKFLFWLLLGALYIVAGFVTFENPLLAAALLTLLLGIALVAWIERLSVGVRRIVRIEIHDEGPGACGIRCCRNGACDAGKTGGDDPHSGTIHLRHHCRLPVAVERHVIPFLVFGATAKLAGHASAPNANNLRLMRSMVFVSLRVPLAQIAQSREIKNRVCA